MGGMQRQSLEEHAVLNPSSKRFGCWKPAIRALPRLSVTWAAGRAAFLRWRHESSGEGDDAFPGHGRLKPEQERMRRLEREKEILRQERDVSRRKGGGHLLTTKQMGFLFIEDHRGEFPVTRMCEVLNVSPSGYHAWRKRVAIAA